MMRCFRVKVSYDLLNRNPTIQVSLYEKGFGAAAVQESIKAAMKNFANN
jgi:hypothetical protein